MNAKELQEYRTKNYRDLYSGIIPDRFPVNDGFSVECLIQYAGKDLLTTQYQYTTELLIEILEKGMEISRGDNYQASYARNAVTNLFTRSRSFTMSKTGMIQHPEVSGMEADEYDEFIENPAKFSADKVQIRLNEGYQGSKWEMVYNYMKQYFAAQDMNRAFAEANAYIKEKYGMFTPPDGTTGMTAPPFDSLADFNRGFTNISIDIKRRPQKVLDAIEALMPQAIAMQRFSKVDILGASRIMTHMGVFLNKKDFDKFYWPTFYKLCHIAGERGQRMFIFCEGDWTRFIDELSTLPAGTRLWLEYGDPQQFKDKLGDKFILSGFYPLTLLKNGTKQQCIDKAKELVDILAPGGNYFFDFDKHALDLNDINPENYIATMEWVLDNAKYANAGQKSINVEFEDTVVKGFAKDYPAPKSAYNVPFDEYIKKYPPVDDRAIPAMREAYNKYARYGGM
ncbi:MAG: hypothetical protein GX061_03505 [Eubacteriaceae bacterium]|nr:hypothetical protein [Eubacteriaceae bacterium]